MKKMFFIGALCMGTLFSSNAQISTSALQSAAKTASTVATASGFDVKSLSSGIMSKLTTSLLLNKTQSPAVATAVTTFLTQKSSILSLAKTDKTAYASKLSGLTGALKSKLKTALTAEQYTKFLNLKPAQATTANALSQLFF